ncbi:hypothetical protein ASE01_18955 [Nocardioides sp. Root190]|uniref:PASTA domain-containing protein n=1 Tax=Nocardioides sp. Root190 TaxID=1736488 RepID=UPI0006FADD38|nr:PASTA domain-containing protein [Nocardioides sp. Root190]KRB74072.1 hypothetical protein ASE01_18955 [Nocardioides sp. Root190]
MRNKIAVAAALTGLLLTAAGCGGEDAEMPDVESTRLDLALSDIERAGYSSDDVEIVGGGALGVVDEGNWVVCEQDPAPGTLIDAKPRLVVDRECEGDEEPAEEERTEEPSEEPEPEKSAEPEDKSTKSAGLADDPEPAEETFVMPSLVGMNLQAAQDELQALGSYVLTQTDATGAERFQVLDANWKVCWQKPAAGKKVPVSRLVDLGAVKLEEFCP